MSPKNIYFARSLVKGKIAETIFEQMLREAGVFTVLEFGYEKVIPEILSLRSTQGDDVVEMLRSAPDFAVIDHSTKKVHLVEVKYQHTINATYVLNAAKRMHKCWNPSYLFIATLEGFYFDEITRIIKNYGAIAPLQTTQVSQELQNNYLKILQDFEHNN